MPIPSLPVVEMRVAVVAFAAVLAAGCGGKEEAPPAPAASADPAEAAR
ncbi:MAG: hypothetical protein R2712_23635 [Vicinamibacterales bacterium]